MINYLCTSPIPKIKTTDAVYNEMNILGNHFNNKRKEDCFVTSLYPFSQPNSKYPTFLLGLHNLKQIREREKHCKINHIFSSGLFYMPFVRFLSKPTILTVTAGVGNPRKSSLRFVEKYIQQVIVSDKKEVAFLKNKISKKVKFSLPAIHTASFKTMPKPELATKESTFKILYASAPWELQQFDTKCIDILLKSLVGTKNLEMVFLWRGLLYDHLLKLISKYKLEDKVTVINEYTDVAEVMKDIHCTVLLSKKREIIKSYPHSLVESIIAKRPVITTSVIPMQDLIKEKGYGCVLEKITLDEFKLAVSKIRNNYQTYLNNLERQDRGYFSTSTLIDRMSKIYSETCQNEDFRAKHINILL